MFDDIKPIDLKAERRRRIYITVFVFLALVSGFLYRQYRNYPEERQARRFFEALKQQDYQEAYRIWQPTSSYKYDDFLEDWGENGFEGSVKQFHVTGSNRRGSGVVVRVQVNGSKNISLWVERKDKSLSFPP